MTRTIARRFSRGAVLLAVSTILACNNDSAGSDVPYVVTPVSSTTLAGTPG